MREFVDGIVTSLVDNDVGRLIEDLIMQGGVDPAFVRWEPYDGVGRAVRNGLNFTERGFGVRGAVGISDRGHSAASSMRAEDIDWDHLFGKLGVRCFQTGGIFAGLSETTPDVIETAMASAKRHGTIISYDLNYRQSLWKAIGGPAKAQEVNRRRAAYVDVMLGNEEDFTASLGLHTPGTDECLSVLPIEGFKAMMSAATLVFPNIEVIATTLRVVHSANRNDWGAIAWSAASGFAEATARPELEILDRVGGGDSFAVGLIYGLLEDKQLSVALEYGAAHGALAMTTPGDTSTARLPEVEGLIRGNGARAQR